MDAESAQDQQVLPIVLSSLSFGGRLDGPLELRPGGLELIFLREGRPNEPRHHARVLLPHADAMGVELRELFQPRELWPGSANLAADADPRIRHSDERASRQPDHFVANSKVVAERIRRAYGRYAEVIHPPIDIDRFHMSMEREDYYVVLSRLVSYKQIDLAVKLARSAGKICW